MHFGVQIAEQVLSQLLRQKAPVARSRPPGGKSEFVRLLLAASVQDCICVTAKVSNREGLEVWPT